MNWIDPRFWFAVVASIAVGAMTGYFKGYRDADQSHTVETQARRIRELVVERDESNRVAREQQRNAEDASKKRDLARADAAAAAAAADGLRKQVIKLVTRTRDSAVAAGGATACDALDLLADVFGRADEAAGKLARIADERKRLGPTVSPIRARVGHDGDGVE
ncbi:DUF2514 family protein [Burkholderia pseudomultivorans]|uniref:DUF2514 family protein n=1 Tax=Burkholderia pseudomultivorans TaxID=1207504 RepID=UPI0015814100|nr:DUF2514 family protein [Burkholderia pseudomultivorans]